MTKYNTGNPVGSADPKDLYDNAIVVDRYATGDAETTLDRLGVTRKTIAGIDADARAAIANAGYVFVGDYAAGIELTAYNQVVRDTSGEFWRPSGDTELPYTTDGTGLPEGGSLVTVGDAALRQDLVQPVATFSSVQDMKDSIQLGVGRICRTLGYTTPGDGGGTDYEIVASGTGNNFGFVYEHLTGSGHEAKALSGSINRDFSVYVGNGGDFSSINSAIEFLSNFRKSYRKTYFDLQNSTVSTGFIVRLILKTGFIMSEQVILDNQDMGFVYIESEDAEVSIDRSSLTIGEGISGNRAAFFGRNHSILPTIGVLFSMDASGSDGHLKGGVFVRNGSGVLVLPGCGVKNAGGRGLHVSDNSYAIARSAIFDDAGTIGVRVANGSTAAIRGLSAKNAGDIGIAPHDSSTVQATEINVSGSLRGVNLRNSYMLATDALVDNCKSTADAIQVYDNSSLSLDGASVKNSAGNAVSCFRSGRVSCHNADVSGSTGTGIFAREGCTVCCNGLIADLCGLDAIFAERGSSVSVSLATLTNAGRYGVLANNGSRVTADFSDSTGAGTTGFRVQNGSVISAFNASGTISKSANSLDFNGVIFTDLTV